jgi:SAM-dependent methyltransferase
MSSGVSDDRERQFWNWWNVAHREGRQHGVSLRQAEVVESWLAGQADRKILEVGCGTGWMAERLTRYGTVTATDLADEALARASERCPEVRFVAGDFSTVDVGEGYDVVVSLEVLSHVEDQPAFLRRIRDLLAPDGLLVLGTQNHTVLRRFNRVPPPGPGQRRHWVNRRQLRRLLVAAGFDVRRVRTVSPVANRYPMRLVAKAGRVLHVEPLLERLGFGWTIMVAARPRPGPPPGGPATRSSRVAAAARYRSRRRWTGSSRGRRSSATAAAR